MGFGEGTKFAGIRDGSSNTLAISEVIGIDSNRDGRGAWTTNLPGGSLFTARTSPNSTEWDQMPVCDETLVVDTDPLYCEDGKNFRDENAEIWAAARSKHPGGVNSSRCDGSVKFVSDSIDLDVWRALATRAGGEVTKNQ